jgi:menaquinone-dependent protoporphyrinogen oxidase
MNVLIATASRHGSTREIADVIGSELRDAGMLADVRDMQEVGTLHGYDAVILGSAVYMGSWLSEARKFAEQYREQLAARPLWLFSSGPTGDAPHPEGVPKGVAELLETAHARGHRIFAGKLMKNDLGRGERLITRMVHAPEGDFRDWLAIRAWAQEIAVALRAETVPAEQAQSSLSAGG